MLVLIGFFTIPFALVAFLIGFVAIANGQTSSGIGLLVCGLLLIVVFIVQVRKKSKIKKAKKALQDALALELSRPPLQYLPVIPNPGIFLKPNEFCHWQSFSQSAITKNRVVGYHGGGAGISFRVAKGASLRTSSGRAAPIRADVTETIPGSFYITNQRIVHVCAKGGFDKKITSLTSVEPYGSGDGFQFQFGAQNYTVLLPNVIAALQASKILDGVFSGLPVFTNTNTAGIGAL